MTALPHVYIAGPYTHPDPVKNTRLAVDVGMTLYARSLAYPVIPHLSLFVHYLHPRPVDFWYEYDLHALRRCDFILRLPGQSTGADREVAEAVAWNIPVFTAVPDLQEHLTALRERGARA